MKILGIDEAGRGCVIGPLVMCGYQIDENNNEFIQIESRLKDSKQLSKTKREELYSVLTKLTESKAIMGIVEVEEIDRKMAEISLNDIEEKCALDIISSSEAKEIYIDCFSTKKNMKEEFIKKAKKNVQIFLEFKADSKYKIVSAASIVAKVTRDNFIKKINEKYKKQGFIVGSGYPSDSITINFLNQYFKKFNKIPPEARTRWKTIENIKQRTLFDYK
ncbi:MAG: ribonuclease HII [Candidatus Aenigmarchaeota archaeon]|nr:ribonuclease HII [Candidatus Aenigmarchaeota archaeon]